MSDESLGVSPSGPGSSLQPQAASAAIPDAARNEWLVLTITDAYEAGVGKAFRECENPWTPGSREAAAWELGREFGRERGIGKPGPSQPISDDRIDYIADKVVKAMPEGLRGFCRVWGWQQFARELLEVCGVREGSSPDRANPARDESPKAIEPDPKGRTQGELA